MMTSLLKTEWLKLKKYWAFWLMTGIVALTYPGINYMMYKEAYKNNLNDKRMGPILRMIPNPFTFPDVWHTVSFISSFFLFLPAIVVIMFITNEYSYKTHRQNVIDGWSRNQFLLAKMIDVFIVSVVVTVLYAIVAFILGNVNRGTTEVNVLNNTRYIGLFFLLNFSQLSIAFLIAFLVRKAFIALGLFVFYFFPLEPLLVALAREKASDAGRYLPLEISDRMIPIPRMFISNEKQWASLVSQANLHIIYSIVLTTIIWLICFWINKKRNL
jgi:ABC-2 type transport system permease protein